MAQALAAAVVPRHATRVDLRTRRLADDEDPCRRACLQHGARAKRQMRFACTAGPHRLEQAVERRVDFGTRVHGDVDRLRVHKRG